jgi:hypothetical protein
MLVEVLVFDGCPNGEGAFALARQVVATEFPEAEVRLVDVPDTETAERHKFLGSPSIQVNGIDIEESRLVEEAFSYSCRVYRTEKGVHGLPPEDMLRRAIRTHAGLAP